MHHWKRCPRGRLGVWSSHLKVLAAGWGDWAVLRRHEKCEAPGMGTQHYGGTLEWAQCMAERRCV